MITETQIDQLFDDIGKSPDEAILDFVSNEKAFSGYLLSDQFSLLSESEKESLLFIHIVLWRCYEKYCEAFDFNLETFADKEESNWTLIDDNKLSWESKIDLLFKDYKQEDLLAFVEDMLNEEEEITVLSKELIFVTAKSYIDYRF